MNEAGPTTDSTTMGWWQHMRQSAVLTAILLLGAFLGFGVRSFWLIDPPTTVTSLSPDDKWRVILVERRLFIDRNFHVRLEEVETGQTRTIFQSPDEGRPIGSERFVWSQDASRFLLLGRHFYRCDSAALPSGEQAYLMMDLNSDQIWCNAGQQTQFPEFGTDEIAAINWIDWTPP